MSSQPTLKFLGAAIVAAAFSTGALAQTSSTPSATPPDGSAPTSNGAMTNNPTDSGAKSHKSMRKHKTEKDNSASANPKNMKNAPAGEGTNGATNTSTPKAGTGSQ